MMATRTDSTPAGGEKNRAETAVPPRATNAIEVPRGRKGSIRAERGTDAAVEPRSAQRKPENSIQPARRRVKASDALPGPDKPRDATRHTEGQAAGREQRGQEVGSPKAAPE